MGDFEQPSQDRVSPAAKTGVSPLHSSKQTVSPSPNAPSVQGSGGGEPSLLQRLFAPMFGSAPAPGHGSTSVPTPQVAAPTPASIAPVPTPGTAQVPLPSPVVTPQEPTPEQRVDAAVQTAQGKLSYGPFDWVVKDSEARDAMTALTGLPPDLRAKAVEQLDAAAFSRLLTEVPPAEREKLRELVGSCTDPERKLRLFAAAHHSQVDNDALKERAKSKDDSKKNEERDSIVQSTHNELDAETTFLLARVKEGKLSAAEVQRYIDGKEQEHQAEMKDNKNITGTLAGLSDADRVEYTRSQVERRLNTGLLDWAVTDQEARESHALLRGLPKELRTQALVQMGRESFEKLLTNIPDPKDQLELWADYHSATVKHDAATEKQKTQDEGAPGAQTAAQRENQRINARRNQIVATTDSEIEDEVKFLSEREKNGGPALTSDDVLGLMQRKDREHQIEMKYNVNLTNKAGVRKYNTNPSFAQGSKIFWSAGELEQVESGLARMPIEHVRGNQLLKEIQRSDIDPDDETALLADPTYQPRYGGDHLNGVIRVQDLGVNGTYRHTGDARELQDPKLGKLGGDTISPVEETIVHEFGHDMHYDPAKGKDAAGNDQLSDARTHLETATGWQPDGTYGTDFIPTPANGAKANSSGGDTWDYARTRPNEQFAEMYMKAVLKPETFAHDLLDAPKERVRNTQDQLDAAERAIERLKSNGATPLQIQQAEQRRDRVRSQLTDAQKARDSQAQQFGIMRNEVFHTDKADGLAAERLRNKGVAPEKIREFQERTARASTPQQVELIEKEFSR